jgi:RNA polymerase sigma factor (sigma-70 family)
MNVTDNLKLLRDYADQGDEAAFRKLVERYVDMVYSAALRRVGGDAGLAQDVTQTVFTDLARKATSLRKVELLGGWLHRHTGFVASNLVRSEQRRQIREQEAVQMNATHDSAESLWQQMMPLLDDTIESLEPEDRQAILLRFFERHDFRHIGSTLGISDDAAQKRVSRALEKLRGLLTSRGVKLSAVILGTLLAGKVVAAAPSGLAASISKAALVGAAGGGLGLVLINLTKSFSFKVALGGIIAVVALWAFLITRSNTAPAALQQRNNPVPVLANSANPQPTLNQAPVIPSHSVSKGTFITNNTLVLTILAADSGQPVPNVQMDCTLTINGKTVHTTLQATRFGVCNVSMPKDATELRLMSERDGFANTLLDWNLDQGDQIPAQYTLQLARSVPISGTVVGPDGSPVAGAQASIDVIAPAAPQMRSETDNFAFHHNAITDAKGHWQIDRIGKEAVKNLQGWATDPNFANSPLIQFVSNADAEKQLLQGMCVFKLQPGVLVQGLVKNLDGQPVPNANVLVGHAYQRRASRTKTRSDGTFSIMVNITGRDLITAEADGYGATTIQADLSGSNGPFQLVLRPGKLLKLRVVDENGNAVPNANVMLNPLRDDLKDLNGKAPPPVEVRFRQQVDTAGRLEWSNAPDRDLNFIVSADGYMINRGVNVQPDGTEHVVTLQAGLTVSGTVTDAATGRPIPKFRVIAGWPEHGYFNGPTLTEDAARPHWSTFKRDWHLFGNGKFHFVYDSPMVIGEPNPDYIFRFEADGYAPFVTRIVKATEGSAHFDVELASATTKEITVISPDQKVVAEIDVGFVSPGAELVLIPGGFSHETAEGGAQSALVQTDTQGQFALPSDPAVTKVVAANAQGYAEATPAELTANPVMQLQPWGRIEGRFVSNGQPLANRTLSIGFGQKSQLESIHCDWTAFQTKTDNEGRFTLAQVPLGDHEVTLIASQGNGSAIIPLQPITITSGTTTKVTVDIANLNLPDRMRERFGLGDAN